MHSINTFWPAQRGKPFLSHHMTILTSLLLSRLFILIAGRACLYDPCPWKAPGMACVTELRLLERWVIFNRMRRFPLFYLPRAVQCLIPQVTNHARYTLLYKHRVEFFILDRNKRQRACFFKTPQNFGFLF